VKTIVYCHVICLVVSYSLVGFSYLVCSHTTDRDYKQIVIFTMVFWLAFISSFTGLGLLLGSSFKSQKIIIAISTVASFLLLALTC
jgi:hypothetical protein